MYRTPKNVKPKKGLNVAYVFLREDEILKADDLVRSTQYPNTYSDDINYEYLNAMNWEYVKDKLPGWIGRTVEDYKNFGNIRRGVDVEVMRMIIFKEDIVYK